jgi:hypothetical protein
MTTTRERIGPLLLLDGMSLAFRAFFALPDTLETTTGVVTNAVHGFSSMLVYLVRERRPSGLVVAFDAPGATFRDEILEDYKAGRAATPDLQPEGLLEPGPFPVGLLVKTTASDLAAGPVRRACPLPDRAIGVQGDWGVHQAHGAVEVLDRRALWDDSPERVVSGRF